MPLGLLGRRTGAGYAVNLGSAHASPACFGALAETGVFEAKRQTRDRVLSVLSVIPVVFIVSLVIVPDPAQNAPGDLRTCPAAAGLISE